MVGDQTNDPFAEMLGRATEDPPDDLVDRMRAFAGLADATPAPRRRLPRAGTFALVAASLALVVGAAVFAGSRGSDDPAAPAAADGNYLPREWPEVLDSAVSTGTVRPSDDAGDSASWLLAQDGVAAAQLVAYDEADGAESPSRSVADQVSGTWTGWFFSDAWSGVVLARSGGDPQRFAPLTSGQLGRGLDLHEDRLPTGWTVIDDPEGVLTAAFTGSPLPGTDTAVAARRDSAKGLPSASVMTIRVDDPGEALELVDAFAGGPPGEQHLDLGTGAPALLVDHVTTGGSSVVWSPGPGIVVVVAATILTDEELLSIARSSRPVSAAEWSRLTPPGSRELPEATCRALDARPEGLGPVSDRNGVTQLGGSWSQVLSEDLFRLTTGDRRRVAAAVEKDREGFDRILEHLTDAERAPLLTMRDVALEPDRIDELAVDDEVRTAAFLVMRLGRHGCGFA